MDIVGYSWREMSFGELMFVKGNFFILITQLLSVVVAVVVVGLTTLPSSSIQRMRAGQSMSLLMI